MAPRERRPSLPVRVHKSRTLVPADITTIDRIPVTRPARMCVDLADTLTKFQLANILHRLAYRGLLNLTLIEDAMARANGRKLTVLRQAIALYQSGSAGTRSTAEDTFLRRIELPEPLVNTPLLGEEVDFHWPPQMLVVEIDGPHHGRPTTRLDDARKDAKLREAGYTVLRVSDRDVQSGACYDLICFTYASW